MTYQSLFFFLIIITLCVLFIYFSLSNSINAKNPVVAILYLILFFFGLCILFIIFGADYLGILFLIVYAGAISIIFLFVIMFLDFKELALERFFFSKLTSSFLFLIYVFSLLDLFYCFTKTLHLYHPTANHIDWFLIFIRKSNIEAVGLALYERFLFQFLTLGFVLFLIMVLVISLLINYNFLTKKQIISSQLRNKTIIFKTK